MSDRAERMSAALRRIELDLPPLAPALWSSLRGPAEDAALDDLRSAIAPAPLPAELETLLRSHDGQSAGGDWWPTLDCGPLLGARDVVKQTAFFRTRTEPWQWSAAWIPVAQTGWYQAALDSVPSRSGTVINASWPDTPRAVAPTLADALEGVIDLARAGLLPTHDDGLSRRRERHAFLSDLWRPCGRRASSNRVPRSTPAGGRRSGVDHRSSE